MTASGLITLGLATATLSVSKGEWDVMPHHHRGHVAKALAVAGIVLEGINSLLGLRF